MDLTCEERASDSPLVERVWRSQDSEPGAFISMANGSWSLVVSKIQEQLYFTVRGPETYATPAWQLEASEHFGIQFRPGSFLRGFPPIALKDRCDARLPRASDQSFWLNSEAWQFPDYDNADTFIDWLVRDDLLQRDPLVEGVLEGRPVDTSVRTVQRRFLHATGMTFNTMRGIERARYATTLLKDGVSILDTVEQAGYADQPHLTRALRRFIGQTPGQIAHPTRQERLSFLFKTPAPV